MTLHQSEIIPGSSGSTPVKFEVPTINNRSDGTENGTITATLEPGANYKRAADPNDSATVTVNDDGGPIQVLQFVELTNPITEGTSETTNTTHNVTVNLGSDTAHRMVTATYTLSSDEATGGAKIPEDIKIATGAPGRTNDTTGTLTFNVDDPSFTIPLEIIADDYDEADTESFTITLSSPTGATIGDPFTGSIADDDDPPKATISVTHTAPEGTGANDQRGANALSVTLSAASTKVVKVNYAFGNDPSDPADTAEINVDYTATDDQLQLVFNPDDTTGLTATSMVIPFSITDDSINEDSETFTITLSIPEEDGNASVEDATKVSIVTITDNDTTLPIIGFERTEEKGVEDDGVNNGSITFTISLTNSDGTPATAGRNIDAFISTSTPANLRAGATPSTDPDPNKRDYTALTNQRVTIAKGASSATFNVETIEDDRRESDEQFVVTISRRVNAAESSTANEATGKILSNEISVFEIVDVSQPEGNTDNTMNFIVTLSSGSRNGEVSVEYRTVDGTAGQPDDYTQTMGTLRFSTDNTDNNITQMIPVTIKGDDVHEGGNQTFFVELFNALPTSEVDILSGGERATGTIEEDDAVLISEISVAATAQKVTEGEPVKFTFTSNPGLVSDVDMMITLTETGGDFLAPTVNRRMITLDTLGPTHIESFNTIAADTKIDPDSIVTLTIETDETRYMRGTPHTASVIVEDVATPTGISIVVLEESVMEGPTASAAFQVKSDVVDTNARIINLSITQDNVNFLTPETITNNQQVTIPADQRVVTFSLSIHDDDVFERNGNIQVEIADSGGGSATYTKASSDTTASVLVLDNDFEPTESGDSIAIWALADTVAETENAPFQIVAKSSDPDARTIRVMVTNKDSGDFLPATYDNPVEVVIDADALIKNFEVTLDDDSKYEETGAIVATVIAEDLTGGGNATYTVSTSQPSAEIEVTSADLEVPVISITSMATDNGVTEEHSFDFEVVSDRDLVGNALDIAFIVMDASTGAMVEGTTVMIPGNMQRATGTVSSIGDVDSDTEIIIRLLKRMIMMLLVVQLGPSLFQ